MIRLFEHPSDHYSPRTFHNVSRSNATLALAVDFTTFGEICTKNAATRCNKPYLGLPFQDTYKNFSTLIKFCKLNTIHTLNIAGNGLYTFKQVDPNGYSQEFINDEIFIMLDFVLSHPDIRIKKVLTGGQTGVDWAAIIACRALEIDCDVTFPKGYKQRNAFGIDFYSRKEELREKIFIEAKKVLS